MSRCDQAPSSPPETPTNGTRFKFYIKDSDSSSASDSPSDISTESSLADSTQQSLNSVSGSHFAPQLQTSAEEDTVNPRVSNSVQPQIGPHGFDSDVIYSTKPNFSSVVEHPQMQRQGIQAAGLSGSVDPATARRDDIVLYSSSHGASSSLATSSVSGSRYAPQFQTSAEEDIANPNFVQSQIRPQGYDSDVIYSTKPNFSSVVEHPLMQHQEMQAAGLSGSVDPTTARRDDMVLYSSSHSASSSLTTSSVSGSHFAPQLQTSAEEDIVNPNSVQPQIRPQGYDSDVIYSRKPNFSSVVEHPQMQRQEMQAAGLSGSVDPTTARRDDMVLYSSSHSASSSLAASSVSGSHFALQFQTSAAEDIANPRVSNSVQGFDSDVIYSTKPNFSPVVEHPQMQRQGMQAAGLSGSRQQNTVNDPSLSSNTSVDFESFKTTYQFPTDSSLRDDNQTIYRSTPTRSEGYNNQLQLASPMKATHNGLLAEHVDDPHETHTQQLNDFICAISALKNEQEKHHTRMIREMHDFRRRVENHDDLCDLRNHNFFVENKDPVQYPLFAAGDPKLPRLKKDLLNLSDHDCQAVMYTLKMPKGPKDEPLQLKRQRIAEYLGCRVWR